MKEKSKITFFKFPFFGRMVLFGLEVQESLSYFTTKNGRFWLPTGIILQNDDREKPNIVMFAFVFLWFKFMFGYSDKP